MSSGRSAPVDGIKKTRGRRRAVRIPCDDCIRRAAQNTSDGNITLCHGCLANLRQHRGKQREIAGTRQTTDYAGVAATLTSDFEARTMSLPWSDDAGERHALQFFCVHSAPQLAGYFDAPFWQQTVLRAGRHEPAVRHAIAAVGALHERLLAGDHSPDGSHDRRTQFALEQCNKSIRYLMQDANESKKPNARLMIITCLLFTTFDAMQERWQEAIEHAAQGYNLLQYYESTSTERADESSAFAVELDHLRSILMRLHVRMKALINKDYGYIFDAEEMQSAWPTHFNSLHEAMVSLEAVMNLATVLFLDLDLDDQLYETATTHADLNSSFRPWLQSWDAAFAELLTNAQVTASPANRKAAMILKANALVTDIFTNVDLSRGESAWEVFQDKFQAIVDLAAAVLEADDSVRSRSQVQKTKTTFISTTNVEHAFGLGIITPLCEVCARCSEPIIRGKALELLSRYSRRECMWRGWSSWKVEKYLFGLEKSPDRFLEEAVDVHIRNQAAECGSRGVNEPLSAQEDRAMKLKRVRAGCKVRRELNPGLFAGRTDEGDAVQAGGLPTSSMSYTR